MGSQKEITQSIESGRWKELGVLLVLLCFILFFCHFSALEIQSVAFLLWGNYSASKLPFSPRKVCFVLFCFVLFCFTRGTIMKPKHATPHPAGRTRQRMPGRVCREPTGLTPGVHELLEPHGWQAYTSSWSFRSFGALPELGCKPAWWKVEPSSAPRCPIWSLGPLEFCRKRTQSANEDIYAPICGNAKWHSNCGKEWWLLKNDKQDDPTTPLLFTAAPDYLKSWSMILKQDLELPRDKDSMVISDNHEEKRKRRHGFQLCKIKGSRDRWGQWLESYLQKSCKGIHRYLCGVD